MAGLPNFEGASIAGMRRAPFTSFLSLRYHVHGFKVGVEIPDIWDDYHHLTSVSFCNQGLDMGEVIQFVSKSERERARLIREARAIYDSIFPPADPAPINLAVNGANRSDGGLLS
jgi:hypothetical protein